MPVRKGIILCATTVLTDVDAITTITEDATATIAAADATTTAVILISGTVADAVPSHLLRLQESISAF